RMVHQQGIEYIPLGRVARVIGVQNKNYGEVRKEKLENGKLARDKCANCPPHALVVNDSLDNYKIEGPSSNRKIINVVTGQTETLDLQYYVGLLANTLS